MKKKNTVQTIKSFLAFVITVLTAVVLFGIIFVSLGLATPSPAFFLELGGVVLLTLEMKIFWYDWAENKRYEDDDIKKAKGIYDDNVSKEVKDITHLEKFLTTLDEQNREDFVKHKLGIRTKDNTKNYAKIKMKFERRAYRKIKRIRSVEIMTRGESPQFIDSKNYTKSNKRAYQIITSIVSMATSVFIASIVFNSLMLSWESAFRFATYLFSIGFTILTTIFKAYKSTGDETLDHLLRLQLILDKYKTHKEKESKCQQDEVQTIKN